MRARGAAIALVAAAMILWAAQSRGQPPPPISNAERLAAMLSVHAHAYWPDRHFPEGVRPITLEQAVRILVADDDRLAPSRRRRAIGKLAGYALDQSAGALRRLGADPVRIREALKTQARTHGNRFHQNAVERETFVNDMLQALTAADCQWKKLRYAVGGSGPVISVTTQLWVDWEPKRVARGLDPQSWDQCSKFWTPSERTYLAKENANADIIPDGTVNLTDAYGGSKGARCAYEHFTCTVQGCDSFFKNLLSVSTWWDNPSPSIDRYNVWYDLDRWLDGEVSGKQQALCVDQGDLTVQKDPTGGSIAQVTKWLSYASPGLTGIAQAILMHSEHAAEFAEVVCCVPNDPAQGPDKASGGPFKAASSCYNPHAKRWCTQP